MYSELQGNGPVTIVFDAGLGHSMLVWRASFEKLSSSYKTLAYDRAGLGYSDKSEAPRTSMEIVNEMHELLKARSIDGPLILVGHYFGGLNMLLFAKTYPEQVKGLLLVESAHPEQLSHLPPIKSWRRTGLTLGKWASPLGLPRLYLSNADAHHKAVMTTVKHQYTSLDEAKYFEESTAYVANSVDSLGDLPLLVLSKNTSSTESKKQLPANHRSVIWAELQESLLSLSNNSSIVNSGSPKHNIHRVQPELVLEALETLVQSIDD